MHRPRLIPCLLLDGGRLVKTQRFDKPAYVGDPINTLKIFNEKEVDELIMLDIRASRTGAAPDFELAARLASECFMPMCYGGGVRSVDDAARLIAGGIEKIAINSAALDRPELIGELAQRFGSSSVVVGIDVRRALLRGQRVWHPGRRSATSLKPVDWARRVTELGAGEVLLNSVDRDGTLEGYDLDLIREVSAAVTVPVIAAGGAASLADCKAAITSAGASAAAAGALFVYKGPLRAVLINYPTPAQLQELF